MTVTIPGTPDAVPAPTYTFKIFVEGSPGYFKYSVGTKEQAMDHFAQITKYGYRRNNDRGELEWYAPQTLKFIKVIGPGLETNYPDEFVRT